MEIEFINKFKKEFDLSKDDIDQVETFFKSVITDSLKKRFLSHLVSTIEDLVNDKQKKDFIEDLKAKVASNPNLQSKLDMNLILESVNNKNIRLFTIILKPLPISAISARTNYIRGSALVTYDNRLDEKDIRLLIAHELGHIIHKHFFPQISNLEPIATLFAFIAMCDKHDFYKTKIERFISTGGYLEIYNKLCALCK
ncbi:MAG: M48 family metalloprotease [Spirochaetaceae bacterium]|nr:M48 family metalloprotease [Spirochaetaceae bacterium]